MLQKILCLPNSLNTFHTILGELQYFLMVFCVKALMPKAFSVISDDNLQIEYFQCMSPALRITLSMDLLLLHRVSTEKNGP